MESDVDRRRTTRRPHPIPNSPQTSEQLSLRDTQHWKSHGARSSRARLPRNGAMQHGSAAIASAIWIARNLFACLVARQLPPPLHAAAWSGVIEIVRRRDRLGPVTAWPLHDGTEWHR